MTACQKKESAGGSGAIKVSAKDAEKAAGYLIMDGTTVMGYKEGLPAKLVIPEGVTKIGVLAFNSCFSLTEMTIPGSVKTIGDNAFVWCTKLKSVTIAEGVTEIGKEEAFKNCTSLTSVTIPASVTLIGGGAFENCDSLKEINYAGTKAQWDEIETTVYARSSALSREKKSKDKKNSLDFYGIVNCADGVVRL
ncbi:MAG: leucine-rich repeat domain-containing protein [Treponema sp.]|nr:leucine-rich repeat domain-containing protein [Treponema sp.]